MTDVNKEELRAEFKEKYGDICREEYNPDWVKKREQKWIYSNKSEEVFDWFYSKLTQAKEEGKREERASILEAYKQTTGIESDIFIKVIELSLSSDKEEK